MRTEVSPEWAPSYELVLAMGSPAGLQVSDSLGRRHRELGQGSDVFWAHLLSVAVEAPAPRDSAAFLAHLSVVPPVELRRRLAGYYVRWFRRLTPPEVMEQALGGDPAAQRRFLATSAPRDPAWQAALRALLSRPARELHAQLLRFAEDWVAEVEPQLAPTFARLRREARRPPLEELGLEYVPEPGIEHALLIPSEVIHPERHVFDHLQLKLICYPVEPTRPAPAVPDREAVRLFQALGDERRLSLVAVLAATPLTAAELADRVGMPITTAIHHLKLLSRAGVVHGGGRGRTYSVGPGLAERVSRSLPG